jgi:hypothetical protein
VGALHCGFKRSLSQEAIFVCGSLRSSAVNCFYSFLRALRGYVLFTDSWLLTPEFCLFTLRALRVLRGYVLFTDSLRALRVLRGYVLFTDY